MPATPKKPRAKAPAKAEAKAKTAAKAKAPAKKKPAAKKAASTAKKPATAAKTKVAAKKAPAKKAAVKKAIKKAASTAPSTTGEFSLGHFGVAPYKPKKNEEYMSDGQLEHFQTILMHWKQELKEAVNRTIHHLRDEDGAFPDSNDRATQETEFGLELRTRDRERKLVRKIDQALERITQGTYGYCEVTGEEIGLARLEARPIATKCVEAQERYEKVERHFEG